MDVIQHLFYVGIPFLLEAAADSLEIHGELDDFEVVGETHALPVDGLSEIERLVGLEE